MNDLENETLLKELQKEVQQIKTALSENDKKRKQGIINSMNIPIWVAILSIISVVIANLMQQNTSLKTSNAKAAADTTLENRKFKSSLVLKAFDTGDTTSASKMLLFFINHKLLEDNDSSIRKAAENASQLPIIGFNVAPTDLPAVLVSNFSEGGGCRPGLDRLCWKNSMKANPGDIILVQVYFHLTGNYLAKNVTLGLKPFKSTKDTSHIFVGGVASLTMFRSVGYATVKLKSFQSLTFIPHSIRIFKFGQTEGFAPPNEMSLFDTTGFAIGNVAPGEDTQGVLIAQFKVSND